MTPETLKAMITEGLAPISKRLDKIEERRTMTPAQINVLERMPTAVRALAASGAPLTIQALDAELKTANLPVHQRIAIKNELTRAGMLASTDRKINTLARI